MPELHVGLDYRPVALAPDSGIGRQARALISALSLLPGVRLTLYSDGPARFLNDRVVRQPERATTLAGVRRPWRRLWWEHRWLPAILAEDRVDLFVSTANCGLPGPLRHPMKRVAWVHDLFPVTLPDQYPSARARLLYGSYYRHAYRRMGEWADEVVTPSRYTAGECERLYPRLRGRTRVIPNLVRLTRRRVRDPMDLPERFWLAVGSSEPRKNLPFFVQAWLCAGEGVPPLVVVGGDIPAPLREAAGQRLIHLHGLSDARLGELYRRAERLWQPSLAEGFGLPVVEALAAGTPVAVAEGSALDEVAPPVAPRFPPRDGAALVALMHRLAATGRGPEEDAETLRAWAARYDERAYLERVGEWLEAYR